MTAALFSGGTMAQTKNDSEVIRFLMTSYSNTQQAIQFFDTKAGAYLAGTGIFTTMIADSIVPFLVEYFTKPHKFTENLLGTGFLVITIILAISFILETVQVFLQSFYVLSPRRGLTMVKKGNAKGLFWADDIKALLHEDSLNDYVSELSKLTNKQIVIEMAYETAKLSYITTEKLTHLNNATKHIKFAIILWGAILLFEGIIKIALST
jgi:hypothetical protein